MLNRDETIEVIERLMDEFFPKGKCQERGQAIALIAVLVYEIYHKEKGEG